jgi:hypothetical protein
MKKLGIKAIVFGALTFMGLSFAVTTASSIAPWFGNQPIQGVQGLGTDADQGENLLQVVKNFINWMLGILGMITLIILLYGGFQMVTAAGDEEKYKAGFNILKQAGIGLVFIGLSWFVISMIFFLIGVITS